MKIFYVSKTFNQPKWFNKKYATIEKADKKIPSPDERLNFFWFTGCDEFICQKYGFAAR